MSALAPATSSDLKQFQQSLNTAILNKSFDKSKLNLEKLSGRRTSMTAALKKRSERSSNDEHHHHKHSANDLSINMRPHMASHKKQLYSNDVKTAKISFTSNGSTMPLGLPPPPTTEIVAHQNDDQKQTVVMIMNSDKRNNQQNFLPQQNYGRSLSWRTNNSHQKQKSHRQSVELVSGTKYRQLEAKYNKSGQINNKATENWLNHILLEYCNEENFDKTTQNAALKKMNIDRNSLLSQGIKADYVNRVYKSMFVYSIGFNNLLKELSGKNKHVKKTIWKVYAILLEFCSEGSFQTMIGEIERDKTMKIQSLREQIEKRQRIIQNNDELNQEKNQKILKQLKVLQKQNANLEAQKAVLLQDFKQAQQSFNHEVGLRLRFENKINEIHGIHHELSTKHSRLYENFNKKILEFEALQKQYMQVSENHLITKEKLKRTIGQFEALKRDSEKDKQLIASYELMRNRFENCEIQMKSSKEDLQNIIKEKSRKISQLEMEMKNGDIMLNMCKSSANQLESQYLDSMSQNIKQQNTINEQSLQLNQLIDEKRNFNQKHMSYVTDIQFLKNKDSQNCIQIEKLRADLRKKQKKIQVLTLDNATLNKNIENLTSNLNNCYENIENMKRTKTLYEQELSYLKKRAELHGQVVRKKDQALDKLTVENKELSKSNQEFTAMNKALQSKSNMLIQQLRSEQEMHRRKYDKLKLQRDELFQKKSSFDNVLKAKVADLEKYMGLYDNQQINLKNQRFQRINLDLRYKQSLQVMEKQNDHIRQLNIKISQNYEEIEEEKRKNRNFQYILKEKEHIHEIQLKALNNHLSQIRKQVIRKKMFVNPMLLEDIKGQLKRAIENIDRLKAQLQAICNKNDQINLSSQKLLQKTKQKYKKEAEQAEYTAKMKLQEKSYELQFEKEKSKHLQQRLQDLQKLLTEKPLGQSSNKFTKDNQKKYLSALKEKSIQIEKLLKQLQNSHDQNSTLLKRITEIQETINQKNQTITDLQKLSTTKQQQNNLIERRLTSPTRQYKLSNASKIQEYEENLASMNQQNHPFGSPKAQFQNQHSQRKDSQSRSRGASRQSNNRFVQNSNNQNSKARQRYTQDTQSKGSSLNSKKQRNNSKQSNPAWRNDFTKKLKNAFNYYQK